MVVLSFAFRQRGTAAAKRTYRYPKHVNRSTPLEVPGQRLSLRCTSAIVVVTPPSPVFQGIERTTENGKFSRDNRFFFHDMNYIFFNSFIFFIGILSGAG